jgi:hypothetical protein
LDTLKQAITSRWSNGPVDLYSIDVVRQRHLNTTAPFASTIRISLSIGVQVDGTILHGWLIFCALSVQSWWSTRYHSGSASRFISSLLGHRHS